MSHPPSKKRSQRGFIISPILYALGLIGVVSGVMYSNFGQALRAGVNVTNSVGSRNDINSAAATLSALTVIDLPDNVLCPPGGAGASAGCTGTLKYVSGLGAFASATAANLPSPCTTSGCASRLNGALEMGVLNSNDGIKLLDPWGHYYIYCRWETSLASMSSSSITVMSAGADGTLATSCGASAAANGSDDQVLTLTGSGLQAKASVWQQNGTAAQYGAPGTKIQADASGVLEAQGLNIGYALGTAPPTSGAIFSGSVGIGTTSPGALLAVNGSVATLANSGGNGYLAYGRSSVTAHPLDEAKAA